MTGVQTCALPIYIHVGDDLSLSYRFPTELLKDWQALDQAVMGQAKKMIRTGKK